MTQVTLRGYILVPQDDLQKVLAELPAHIALTRDEPGCIQFKVTPSENTPLRFDVYEIFTDKAAFEAHQTRVSQSHWGTVARRVSRHYTVKGLED